MKITYKRKKQEICYKKGNKFNKKQRGKNKYKRRYICLNMFKLISSPKGGQQRPKHRSTTLISAKAKRAYPKPYPNP